MTITELLNQWDAITNISEAEQYLTNLYMAGYSYHPDDSAGSIDWLKEMPTEAECKKMDELMWQIFDLCDDKFSNFDPYGYIIDLNPHHIENE